MRNNILQNLEMRISSCVEIWNMLQVRMVHCDCIFVRARGAHLWFVIVLTNTLRAARTATPYWRVTQTINNSVSHSCSVLYMCALHFVSVCACQFVYASSCMYASWVVYVCWVCWICVYQLSLCMSVCSWFASGLLLVVGGSYLLLLTYIVCNYYRIVSLTYAQLQIR